MEAISAQQISDALAQYQRWRETGRQWNMKLVESLTKGDIDEAAKRLGVLRKGIICLETEDTASVLMDYAIRHVRRDGLSAIERCLTQTPPADAEALAWLQAVSQARYSLLQIADVHRGFGLHVNDLLRQESGFLIDVSFSQTAKRHLVLASHVYSMGGYWMTTGAALPTSADVLERLVAVIGRQFGLRPEDHRGPSPEREAELATLAIRTLLAGGMSEHVSYGEPAPRPHFGRAPAGAAAGTPVKRRTGRNDLCPCGSGRKFKNCCLK